MPPHAKENLLPQQPKVLEKSPSIESCERAEEVECSCDEASYGIADAIFSTFLVAPLVVSVWRGTWGLMEQHGDMFPVAQTYFLGILIHVCFALLRSHLLSRSAGAYSNPDGGPLKWTRERILSRVYTYVFILSCIMFWRGGWGLLDMLVDTVLPDLGDPHRPVLLGGITATVYICISALRSSRNILASPYFLVTDGKEPTYIFATRFKKSCYLTIKTASSFKTLKIGESFIRTVAYITERLEEVDFKDTKYHSVTHHPSH